MRRSTAHISGGANTAGSWGATSMDVDWWAVLSSGISVNVCSAVVVFVLASIAMGWMGVDLSICTGARVHMSSSVNFKKSVICMAMAVKLAVAVGTGRANTSVDGGSFALFRSKISVSKSSSSAGSTSIAEVGGSRSSSAGRFSPTGDMLTISVVKGCISWIGNSGGGGDVRGVVNRQILHDLIQSRTFSSMWGHQKWVLMAANI
uniref:Uncharacterized protein n=1 Tax=Romanomermis culicivorax TaxID=13658 RepID=A0A915KUA7_ROMCU